MAGWKPLRKKCTKIKCKTDEGESMEFEICIKKGKFVECKGL